MSHFPGPGCPCEKCRTYQWCEAPLEKPEDKELLDRALDALDRMVDEEEA
jgi:hypothetical protein